MSRLQYPVKSRTTRQPSARFLFAAGVATIALAAGCASSTVDPNVSPGAADGWWGSTASIVAEEVQPNAPVRDMIADCDNGGPCLLPVVGPQDPAFAGDSVRVPLRVVYVNPPRNRATPPLVDRWVTVLNNSFRGTGFQFDLADSVAAQRRPDAIEPPLNEDCWVECDANGAREWARLLLVSHPEVQRSNRLMIYLLPRLSDAAGFGVLPGNLNPYAQAGDSRIRGVYLDVASVIDDPPAVLPHEVGHFFGLYHTFYGGCSLPRGTLPDDLVDDTPRHTNGTYGQFVYQCEPLADTCPLDLGIDPIYNVMSYSSCPNQTFTAGQSRRMQQIWNKYYRRHF